MGRRWTGNWELDSFYRVLYSSTRHYLIKVNGIDLSVALETKGSRWPVRISPPLLPKGNVGIVIADSHTDTFLSLTIYYYLRLIRFEPTHSFSRVGSVVSRALCSQIQSYGLVHLYCLVLGASLHGIASRKWVFLMGFTGYFSNPQNYARHVWQQ